MRSHVLGGAEEGTGEKPGGGLLGPAKRSLCPRVPLQGGDTVPVLLNLVNARWGWQEGAREAGQAVAGQVGVDSGGCSWGQQDLGQWAGEGGLGMDSPAGQVRRSPGDRRAGALRQPWAGARAAQSWGAGKSSTPRQGCPLISVSGSQATSPEGEGLSLLLR